MSSLPDTIDGLQIEIKQETRDATKGLEDLSKTLQKLKQVTGGLEQSLGKVNFDKLGGQIKKLSTALQPLQGFKSQAGGLINSLRNFGQAADELIGFTRFDKFSDQIKLLATSLEPLANIRTQLGATLQSLNEIPATTQALERIDLAPFGENVKKLVAALEPLSTVSSKMGASLNQLSRLEQVSQQLNATLSTNSLADNVVKLVKALEPLSTMGKSQLRAVLSQLKEIPAVMEMLATTDIDAFARQIERVTAALNPLVVALEKTTGRMNTLSSGVRRAGTSFTKFSRSTAMAIGKLTIFGYGVRRLANILSDWITKSNEYVENLHLFRLSMGDATDEALRFAYAVSDRLGLDPAQWIRYQAVFQNMATGFGIASDKAAIMSKNLTQLGYDLSAVFNVSYDTAMRKLESALAGQPRPMREWGFDLSEATLKTVALNKGLTMSVENMTQMQKAQLRFIHLMETAKKQNFFGDMARTIMTPANALRILNQQVLLLRRALGDALMPVLVHVLPYLIAAVKALGTLMRSLATFLGFELPTIDYSDTGLGAIADDAEEAEGAAKKLRKALMGFDEVNVLQKDAGGLGGLGGGDLDLDLDLSAYGYDMLEPLKEQMDALTERLQEPFEKILKTVGLIGAGMLMWKISSDVIRFFDGLSAFAAGGGVAGSLSPDPVTVGTFATILGYFSLLTVKSEEFRTGLGEIARGAGVVGGAIKDWIAKLSEASGALTPVSVGIHHAMLGLATIAAAISPVAGAALAAAGITGAAVEQIGASSKEAYTGVKSIIKPLAGVGAAAMAWGAALGMAFTPVVGWIAGIGAALIGTATIMSQEALPAVDLLGEGIGRVTKERVEPFIDAYKRLDNTITMSEWLDKIITDDDLIEIGSQLDELTSMMLQKLDADMNEELRKLEPLRKILSAEKFAEMEQNIRDSYEQQRKDVEAGEKEILSIYARAAEEGRALREEEKKRVLEIRESMRDAGIGYLSETEEESRKILERMRDEAGRLSFEQAVELINQARTAKEGAIAEAEQRYELEVANADRMFKELKTINEAEYNALIAEAERAKEETIAEAELQYSEILRIGKSSMGEYVRFFDEDTGKIKTKWGAMLEDLKSKFSRISEKIGTAWSNFWRGLKEKMTLPSVSIPSVGSGGGDYANLASGGSYAALASGGITNGPMLALIGDNPGGREVVSPLDDLVDIVVSAVGTAVAQTMQVRGGGGQGSTVVLNVDGREMARAIIPGIDSERSRTGGLQVVVKPT